MWRHHLTDYDDNIIVDFLEYGWPISYISSQLPCSTLHNHPSTRQAQNPTFLREYIAKELQHRAIIGPFKHNPFNINCTISPLQCVPKRDSVEPRIVHDLSFPPGSSVNDGIPRDEYLSEPYKLRLPGIDRLVEFINRKGPGCLVFKTDLRRAYRQIPVDPHDYHLLGMTVDGFMYFHTAMPFGLRSATLACQRTTKAVVYMLNKQGVLVDVYIDDFYGADSADHAHASYARMIKLINDLGLQTSPEKDVPPTHEMICLGVTVNTLTMTMTVPEFRLKDLHDDLSCWLNKSHFVQRDLQQLLGKLAFVTACVRPGRAFSCRLINALRVCHASPKRQAFPVNGSMRSDILWWKYFLDHYNGVSVIPTNITVSNPELFACDSCLSACGAVCFGEYFHAQFPSFILQQHLNINQLELLTIVVCLKLWHDRLRGLSLEILTDNQSSAHALNHQRSTDSFMQCCIRELWLLLALHNIHLIARHIPGKANTLADALSRCAFDDLQSDYVQRTVAELGLTQVIPDQSLFRFTID